MPTTQISNQKLFYAARGQSGAPLLFLHGAGSSHLIWNGQLAALARSAQGIALDLPGHGRSELPGRRSIAEYVEAVREFLDALGIERAVVVGHSMGGAIAQLMALEHPDRVLGLGLIGTGARLRVLPAFIDGVLAGDAEVLDHLNEMELAERAHPQLKELSRLALDRCDACVFHDDFVACDQFDVRDRLGEIRAPSLVLCGDQDRMTPLKYSEYLAANIPNAGLKIVRGAGHMVMLEKMAEVSLALLDLLSAVSE